MVKLVSLSNAVSGMTLSMAQVQDLAEARANYVKTINL